MQKMFGDEFWKNVIIEATHWNYHNKSIQMRNSSNPPKLEDWWTNQYNQLFKEEYGLNFDLPSVFIDTFYDKNNDYELKKFQEETNKLYTFANTSNPFQCKDIKIALTEIRELLEKSRELQDKIEGLETDKNKIKEENIRLKLELSQQNQETLNPGGAASLQNKYCLFHKCYAPMEFALYGLGICIAGMYLFFEKILFNFSIHTEEI